MPFPQGGNRVAFPDSKNLPFLCALSCPIQCDRHQKRRGKIPRRWGIVGIFLAFILLIGSASSFAVGPAQKSLVGCFSRNPEGVLQFGEVPSGQIFALRGDTDIAQQHVNQLVRVVGNANETAAGGGATLNVAKVEALAASCNSVSPSSEQQGVPGKVGEDSVAVPLTGTSSEGKTTPGYQTESSKQREVQQRSSRPGAEPPLAPVHPQQAGQSESDANLDAGSVERTEIRPGTTLGVNGSE